jgi:hypothetical protein
VSFTAVPPRNPLEGEQPSADLPETAQVRNVDEHEQFSPESVGGVEAEEHSKDPCSDEDAMPNEKPTATNDTAVSGPSAAETGEVSETVDEAKKQEKVRVLRERMESIRVERERLERLERLQELKDMEEATKKELMEAEKSSTAP